MALQDFGSLSFSTPQPGAPSQPGGRGGKTTPLDADTVSRIIAEEGADAIRPTVMGIYGQESGGGTNARTSTDGAIGPMQVIPATFDRFKRGNERVDSAEDNFRVGVRYLKSMADKFGNDTGRLAAGYFSGEGNVSSGGDTPYKEDRRDGNGKSVSSYVRDVLARVGNAVVPDAKAAEAPAPDMSKIPLYRDFVRKPQWESLNDTEKAEARGAYFDRYVAPYVPKSELAGQREAFDLRTAEIEAKLPKPVGLMGRIASAGKAILDAAGKGEAAAVDPDAPAAPGAAQVKAPPKIGVMSGQPAPAAQNASMAPVTQDFRDQVSRAYDAATPAQRQQMAQADGVVGQLVRERAGLFEAAPQGQTAAKFDTRAEARAARLAGEGADHQTAQTFGRYGAAAGQVPGTELGAVGKSDFDFDAQQRFNKDPVFSNPVIRAAVKGYEGYKAGSLGLAQALFDATGSQEYADIAAGGVKASQQRVAAIGERGDGLQRNFEGAVSSIAQQLPALLAGVATGTEAVPLAAMFTQTFGQEYGQGRAQGLDGAQAATRAGIFGAFEVIGEKFGLGQTLQAMKLAAKGADARDIATVLAKGMLREIPGEELTTLGQFLTDKIPGIGLNLEAGLAQYLQQAGDTLAQTVMQGGLMMGGTTGVSAGVAHLRSPQGDPAEAVQHQAQAAERASEAEAVRQQALNKAATFFQSRQKHASTLAAEQVVREMAADAGMDPAELLPAERPAAPVAPPRAAPAAAAQAPAAPPQAQPEAYDPRAVLDFAQSRYDRLATKRDGEAVMHSGEDGKPVDGEVAGQALTPDEERELAVLEQSRGDVATLARFYGFDEEPAHDSATDVPAAALDRRGAAPNAELGADPAAGRAGPVQGSDGRGSGAAADGAAAADAVPGADGAADGQQALRDYLYDQALRVVQANKRPSLSLVQRHLRIGYNLAGQLLEQMERDGLVTAPGADGLRKMVGQTRGSAREPSSAILANLSSLTDGQLHERAAYIRAQARANGGWDKIASAERDRVDAELARRSTLQFDEPIRRWLEKYGAMGDRDIIPFMNAARRVGVEEKESDPDEWTPEQRAAYASGDWQTFSRLRGYSEDEIANYAKFISLANTLDERYGDGFSVGLAHEPDNTAEKHDRPERPEAPKGKQQDVAEKVEEAANEAATSAQNSLPEPTDGQKQAGNYKMGHATLHGLDITIENPRGSTRSGTDADGAAWSVEMANHYGYIRSLKAPSGDKRLSEPRVAHPEVRRDGSKASSSSAERVVPVEVNGMLDSAIRALNAALLERVSQRIGGNAKNSGDALSAHAFAQEIKSLLDVPAKVESRRVDALLDKAATDGATIEAHFFGDPGDAQAIRAKGFGSLDVHRQEVVERHVLATLHDSKVLRAIVELVPINVVNMLVGEKLTIKEALNDVPMLLDRLPIDLNDSVRVGVRAIIDAFSSAHPVALAAAVAEEIGGSIKAPVVSLERGSAIAAGNDSHGAYHSPKAADGDHIDVFIGPKPESTKVFVVDQIDPRTGRYDEAKVMLGFTSLTSARAAYLANYEQGWKGAGAITAMSMDDFKAWLKEGDTTKPLNPKVGKPKTEKQAKAAREQAKREASAPALTDAQVADYASRMGNTEANVRRIAEFERARGNKNIPDYMEGQIKQKAENERRAAAEKDELAKLTGSLIIRDGKVFQRDQIGLRRMHQQHVQPTKEFPTQDAAVWDRYVADTGSPVANRVISEARAAGKAVEGDAPTAAPAAEAEITTAPAKPKKKTEKQLREERPAAGKGDRRARLQDELARNEAQFTKLQKEGRKAKAAADLGRADQISDKLRLLDTEIRGIKEELESLPAVAAPSSAQAAEEPTLFSRARGGRVSAEELRAQFTPIVSKWKNGPKGGVEIVQSIDDLPASLANYLRSNNEDGRVEGFFLPKSDKVYLIADNLASAERAQEVVFHEVYGHKGLRAILEGDVYAEMMDRIRRANPKVAKAADEWYDQFGLDTVMMYRDAGQSNAEAMRNAELLAVEEALADLAGTVPIAGPIRRLLAEIQTGLRRIGLDAVADWLEGLSQAETFRLLRDARESVFGVTKKGETHVSRAEDGAPTPAPAAAFSRVRDGAQMNLFRLFERKREGSVDTFGAWDRTVGTQYNKALKDPHFGEVFGYAMALQNEVSMASVRPAELAPALLPKVDAFSTAVRQTILGRRRDKELEGATQAIFAGTAAGRTVAEGKVWSDDQLRADFGLSERGITLYRQARAAINASLDEVAGAEAYAMSQGFVPRGLRRQIIEDPAGARGVLLGALGKQIKMLERATAAASRGKSAEEKAAALQTALGPYHETYDKIGEIFDRVGMLKAAGYAPMMRFGKYTVYANEVGPNGEVLRDENDEPQTLYFGVYETEAEAIRAADQLRARYADRGDVRVTRGKKDQKGYELFSGISPETVALFGDVVGQDEATKKFYQQALAERSALKRRLTRRAIEGYSTDLPRVLANFITSNGRHAAQRYYVRDLMRSIRQIPKSKGDVKDEAITLRNYMMDANDAGAGASSLMFAYFLGGSVASAVVNLTQPFMMTAPYLSQWGATKTAAAMAKALPFALGKKQIADPELRAALKRGSQEGIVEAQEIFHLYSQGAQTVSASIAKKLARIPKVGRGLQSSTESARARMEGFFTLWGMMFAAAESFNRKLTFVAAWDLAKSTGQADPYAFAVRAVNETQGIFNKVNRPNWARGTVGRLLMTFKQYSIMYLELVRRMWRAGPEGKKAALMMMAVLVLSAGAEGLPFSQDITDLVDTIGQAMGYDTNLLRDKRKWAHEVLGKTAGDFALYGVSSMLPLDFSGRLGLGNLIPGTGLLKPAESADRTREVTDVVGPAGALVSSAMDAYDAWQAKQPSRAVMALMPKAVNNAAAGLEMAMTDTAKDYKGRKVTDVGLGDAIIKGVGFTPTVVAEDTRRRMPARQDIALVKKIQGNIMDLWSRGLAEGDKDMQERAAAWLQDWNEKNPESPIVVTNRALINQVKQMATPSADRMLKGAPKGLRGRLAEGLVRDQP